MLNKKGFRATAEEMLDGLLNENLVIVRILFGFSEKELKAKGSKSDGRLQYFTWFLNDHPQDFELLDNGHNVKLRSQDAETELEKYNASLENKSAAESDMADILAAYLANLEPPHRASYNQIVKSGIHPFFTMQNLGDITKLAKKYKSFFASHKDEDVSYLTLLQYPPL